MATHSSTLAWKIPWTKEPCRLQSRGSQRVGHDWATSLHFTSHSMATVFSLCSQLLPHAWAFSIYKIAHRIWFRILSIALRDELKVLNTVEWLNDYCFVLLDCYPLSLLGFPGGLDGKESACNAGDPGLIPGLGRSCGEGNGNPLQYSWVEDSMDKGAL